MATGRIWPCAGAATGVARPAAAAHPTIASLLTGGRTSLTAAEVLILLSLALIVLALHHLPLERWAVWHSPPMRLLRALSVADECGRREPLMTLQASEAMTAAAAASTPVSAAADEDVRWGDAGGVGHGRGGVRWLGGDASGGAVDEAGLRHRLRRGGMGVDAGGEDEDVLDPSTAV